MKKLANRQVSTWEFTDEVVRKALAGGAPTFKACNSWHSGAYLLETVPSALFILERHGNDPEEAIVRAVNDTRDNDTIGAIVGCGGRRAARGEQLPERWKTGLLGRTAEDDDGRVQELLGRRRRSGGDGHYTPSKRGGHDHVDGFSRLRGQVVRERDLRTDFGMHTPDGRDLRSSFRTGPAGRTSSICDANESAPSISAFKASRPRRCPARFGVVVSLEGTALRRRELLRRRSDFRAYTEAASLDHLRRGARSWGGVHRPHILLGGVEDWGGQGAALVEAGCVELLACLGNGVPREVRAFGRTDPASRWQPTRT